MNPVLAYLPLFALVILGINWSIRTGSSGGNSDWRSGALQALVIWFVFIWFSTELLSIFNALVQRAVLSAWLLFGVCAIMFGFNRSSTNPGRFRKPGSLHIPLEGYLLGAVVIITFTIALVSPPNNNDTISYHLPRVMHWIQNRSVDFYPTVIPRQLFMPPLAEYGLLHMVILGGGDGSLGLLQWISFAGAVTAVSLAARWLGIGKKGQWLAGIFVASLPMAILQSTSTQNDLVTAFFAAVLLERVLRVLKQKKMDVRSIGWISLSTALGMSTKGTFVAFCIPLLVLVGLLVLRREGFFRAVILTSCVAGAVFVFNSPLWVRNLQTFDSFLGPEAYLSSQQGLYLHPLEAFSNLLKNFSFHLSTPLEEVNLLLKGVYVKFHELIRVDLNTTSLHQGGSKFSLGAFSNHEDLAGNPVHFLLFVLAAARLAAGRWKCLSRNQRLYAGIWAVTWLFFSILFPWQPWGSRLQLSLFVLGAPLAVLAFPRAASGKTAPVISLVLVFLAVPWLLFNKTRPAVGARPYTAVNSVFTTGYSRLLFANRPALNDQFTWLESQVEALECTMLGMEIDSSSPEFFLWWSTSAPFNGRELVHLHPESDPAVPESVMDDVCAEICMICDEKDTNRNGMPLLSSFGRIRIYAESPGT